MGVVGDRDQAIYGFQGATLEAFEGFSLLGQVDCSIEGNCRSTRRIAALLDAMRSDDLRQHPLPDVEGEPVRLAAGGHTPAWRGPAHCYQTARFCASLRGPTLWCSRSGATRARWVRIHRSPSRNPTFCVVVS